MSDHQNPIWAVELSYGQECFHSHWVRYYTNYDKAVDKYHKVLISELEHLLKDNTNIDLLNKYKRKSDHKIQVKIQELITDAEDCGIAIYFNLIIYNVIDRIES